MIVVEYDSKVRFFALTQIKYNVLKNAIICLRNILFSIVIFM